MRAVGSDFRRIVPLCGVGGEGNQSPVNISNRVKFIMNGILITRTDGVAVNQRIERGNRASFGVPTRKILLMRAAPVHAERCGVARRQPCRHTSPQQQSNPAHRMRDDVKFQIGCFISLLIRLCGELKVERFFFRRYRAANHTGNHNKCLDNCSR